MIDFSPYQVWFYRDPGARYPNDTWFFAKGPNCTLQGSVGNAHKLANSKNADAWLWLIKQHLDNREDEFLTAQR